MRPTDEILADLAVVRSALAESPTLSVFLIALTQFEHLVQEVAERVEVVGLELALLAVDG